jgi:hypothetical protein
VVCRYPLQAADGDRLFVDSAAPAGGFAGPVADPAENSGKNVGNPVDHVGLGVIFVENQPDIFGNIGVGWAGILTVNYFVKILGIGDVGRFHRRTR